MRLQGIGESARLAGNNPKGCFDETDSLRRAGAVHLARSAVDGPCRSRPRPLRSEMGYGFRDAEILHRPDAPRPASSGEVPDDSVVVARCATRSATDTPVAALMRSKTRIEGTFFPVATSEKYDSERRQSFAHSRRRRCLPRSERRKISRRVMER